MTAPYWLDYLTRERTMCAICATQGKGWVRVGDPLPVGASSQRGVLAAFRSKQRATFRRHVVEVHPDLRVRWTR